MSVSYNLRSLQRKKGISIRNCHLQDFTGDRAPEAFNPKVCLERLKLLECHDIQNSKFYLKNGKIIMKQNKSAFSSVKFLVTILWIVLIIISLIYLRDTLKFNSINFYKKYSEIYPAVQKYYSAAVGFHRNMMKQFNFRQSKSESQKKESKPVVTKDDLEIRQIVRDYYSEIKKKSKNKNTLKTSVSFIEEQCNTYVREDFSSVKNFYNTTLIDISNLTDYALESHGAKIVTVYDTEPYGAVTVKFFNIDLWPEFSHFLIKYLKGFSSRGPNSVLMPWKKPGDCWAFKGFRGRVLLELSEEIIVTAITIDHLPKEIIPKGSIESAPKDFSIFGVEESGNQTNKTFLGSYEYKSTGPSTQTFLMQSKVDFPFRRIEVIIESNHGNDKYTCIYKIRVHGHK